MSAEQVSSAVPWRGTVFATAVLAIAGAEFACADSASAADGPTAVHELLAKHPEFASFVDARTEFQSLHMTADSVSQLHASLQDVEHQLSVLLAKYDGNVLATDPEYVRLSHMQSELQEADTKLARIEEILSMRRAENFSVPRLNEMAHRLSGSVTLRSADQFLTEYDALDHTAKTLQPGTALITNLMGDRQVVPVAQLVSFKSVTPPSLDEVRTGLYIEPEPTRIPSELGNKLVRGLQRVDALGLVADGQPISAFNVVKVTEGVPPAEDATHMTNSCHYRVPITCLDLAFISKTHDVTTIGTTLKAFVENPETAQTLMEVKTQQEADKLGALLMQQFGPEVAKTVTVNENATDWHIHWVTKSNSTSVDVSLK